MLTGRFRRAALQLAALAAGFFAAGVAIQAAAGEPINHPLTFFIGDYYGHALAAPRAPDAGKLGLLAFFAMLSALALLAGLPCWAAVCEIARRRRLEGRDLRLEGSDALMLTLMLSALATLVMVSLYAAEVSGQPAETRRLWGRYFEFFAPLLWLGGAPHLVRWARITTLPSRLAGASVMLMGLAGLLISFRAGIVLFPWDATALTAFFHPDPVRANLGVRFPFRAVAAIASLAAAAAVAGGARPWRAALGLFLALGLLSTWLDHIWIGPIAEKRAEFDSEIQVAAALSPPSADRTAILAVDNNDANLAYLGLGGFAQVLPAQPGAPPPLVALAYENLVVISPASPPDGWACPYRGKQLEVCVRMRQVAADAWPS
jgi:hypothetical protein